MGMRSPIVIIGASEQARVVIDILEKADHYTIVGLIDAARPVGDAVAGYHVLGTELDLPHLTVGRALAGFVVAIGDNWTRRCVVAQLARTAPGLRPVSAVHPSAHLARDVSIGAGSVVMAGAVINSQSRIGTHCIINTRSSLDHDGVMGDYSSLGPGATLGGRVEVGELAAVGLGASVIHGRKIGANSVVGAGAVVLRDIPEFSVAYGNPARVVRSRVQGERYL